MEALLVQSDTAVILSTSSMPVPFVLMLGSRSDTSDQATLKAFDFDAALLALRQHMATDETHLDDRAPPEAPACHPGQVKGRQRVESLNEVMRMVRVPRGRLRRPAGPVVSPSGPRSRHASLFPRPPPGANAGGRTTFFNRALQGAMSMLCKSASPPRRVKAFAGGSKGRAVSQNFHGGDGAALSTFARRYAAEGRR